MIVIFVSECEKAALKKTRQILDNFAERIGSTTWKTRITMEGLKTLKVLLSKYATKQTSVACHRIAGKYTTELMWIVGSKLKFNNKGISPTNYTANDNIKSYEDSWFLLQHIKIITAMASLFHDLGKASECFQNKLISKQNQRDPLRHEWVSCILLKNFIGDANTDEEWLKKLSENGFRIKLSSNNSIDIIERPLKALPPIASMLMWLILTHHKLPVTYEKTIKVHKNNPSTKSDIFNFITSELGYEADIKDKTSCLHFPYGLPTTDVLWCKAIKRWTSKALEKADEFKDLFDNGLFRKVLHFALIALKLGDHYFSSMKPRTSANISASKTKLYANTGLIEGKRHLKQTLAEHLNGVTENALAIVHQLPRFEAEMPTTNNIQHLKRRSSQDYNWQNKAVDEIVKWCSNLDIANNGFFAINMASTGCGKTIANAKIMLALSPERNTLRYILALGLRTLTLQTGEAYRNEIGLTAADMAVLVGSKAIRELFELEQIKEQAENEKLDFSSESAEDIFDEFIDYDCDISDKKLATVLQNEKHRNLLYAPVLTCTIDHLMGATESIRGGRGLLPNLRLMSSDLVIDEIDDFVGDDLIAISRLIFLVGMLGRKVMLSSATIQPDLALGFFNSYMNGYRLYAKSRNLPANIGCAWIDEFKSTITNISVRGENHTQIRKEYIESHKKFTTNKANKIKKITVRRKGYIADLKPDVPENHELTYFDTIKENIINLHNKNSETDGKTKISTSWGVVRMANITPCTKLGKYLMNADWSTDYQVKVMVYHSKQVLLMRHVQEKYLDKLLNRKDPAIIFKDPIVRKCLDKSEAKNMIFIVVSTPVEEIGRDHDFNWAVIEPSSFRSIIQMAGRVRRHRHQKSENDNIAILRYNFKGYKNKLSNTNEKVFIRPGYEYVVKLKSYDLSSIIDENLIKEGINSIPRIIAPETLEPENYLIDLEHYATKLNLGNFNNKGPESPLGWTSQAWWLTGFAQILAPFRKGQKSETLYFLPKYPGNENTEFEFCLKEDDNNYSAYENVFGITKTNPVLNADNIWLDRNYYKLLEDYSEDGYIDKSAKRYGFIEIVKYNETDKFEYSPVLGLVKK